MELEEDKPHTEHIEHADEDAEALRAEAIKGEEAEHAEGVLDAARTHWKAVFWALMMSMCIVMEAYDNALIGNMVSPPRRSDPRWAFPPSGASSGTTSTPGGIPCLGAVADGPDLWRAVHRHPRRPVGVQAHGDAGAAPHARGCLRDRLLAQPRRLTGGRVPVRSPVRRVRRRRAVVVVRDRAPRPPRKGRGSHGVGHLTCWLAHPVTTLAAPFPQVLLDFVIGNATFCRKANGLDIGPDVANHQRSGPERPCCYALLNVGRCRSTTSAAWRHFQAHAMFCSLPRQW